MRVSVEEMRNYLSKSLFALLILKDICPQQLRCPDTLMYLFLFKLENKSQ